MAKSTIRTIRIDDDLNEAIERLAIESNTSVNFVVNSAVREHIEWTIPIHKLGFGTNPKYLMNKLFEKLADKECEGIGKAVANEFVKSYLEYRFGGVSLGNWLEAVRQFSKYAGTFNTLVERKNEGEIIIIVEHSSGIKWSHFYEGAARYIFEDSAGKIVKTELRVSKCTVMISSA